MRVPLGLVLLVFLFKLCYVTDEYQSQVIPTVSKKVCDGKKKRGTHTSVCISVSRHCRSCFDQVRFVVLGRLLDL